MKSLSDEHKQLLADLRVIGSSIVTANKLLLFADLSRRGFVAFCDDFEGVLAVITDKGEAFALRNKLIEREEEGRGFRWGRAYPRDPSLDEWVAAYLAKQPA